MIIIYTVWNFSYPAPASRELDFDYVCKCNFFIPNETELEILTDMPVETDQQGHDAALTLIEKGVKNVIVTLGSRGVMWVTNERVDMISAHRVAAIDTTGAGDSFIGCFAHFFVQTGDILHSIRMATGFAALSVTKRGTQSSYPDKSELETFIAEQV